MNSFSHNKNLVSKYSLQDKLKKDLILQQKYHASNLKESEEKNRLSSIEYSSYKKKKRALSYGIFKNAHLLDQNKSTLSKQKHSKISVKNYCLQKRNSKLDKQLNKHKKISQRKLRHYVQNQQTSQKSDNSGKRRSKSQICHVYQYKIPGYALIKSQPEDCTLTRLILEKPQQSSIQVQKYSKLNISQSGSQVCSQLIKQMKESKNIKIKQTKKIE